MVPSKAHLSPARDLVQRAGRFASQAAVFFRGFLEHPAMVASVIPSSRSTIEAMLARIDMSGCRLFVEYGPGVGTFTLPILDRLPPGATLLAIDTNPRFVDYLRATIDDPRFEVVLGSAADVEAIVRSRGHEGADFVISGLPFSGLPPALAKEIVAATYRVMNAGAAFMTYQFKPTARQLTQARFERVETGLALMNVPPCLLTWGWKEPEDEALAAREAAE
jgi:phospholipid N-methyltransferase